MRQLIFVILIGMVACTSSPSTSEELPYYNEATFMPIWSKDANFNKDSLHQIPSFNLINQLGETVTEQTFEDKIYITDFFFTICPGICPTMMNNMADLQEEFKEDEDILLLSHSVMPEVDSVGQLLNYADSKGCIPNKWHLVTGERAEIYTLGRKAYFVEENMGLERTTEEFLHTENFVLIDKNRHIRGIYNGLNQTDLLKLIQDVRTLQKAR